MHIRRNATSTTFSSCIMDYDETVAQMTALPDQLSETFQHAAMPGSLSVLDGVAGMCSIVRDQDFRIRWCNERCATIRGMPKDEMEGTTFRDYLPDMAAEEREDLHREVLESREAISFVQFCAARRLYCRAMPIDSQAFGFDGTLSMAVEAPQPMADIRKTPVRVLKFPQLAALSVLTNVELRTLYDLACGRSNNDTALRHFRSVRTIENHVESIHRKLGTQTRSALVRFATERGVHGFTPDEWDTIVSGAGEIKKAAAALSRAASQRPPPNCNPN